MIDRTFEELGIHLVGEIKLKEKVYVTDPCYRAGTWCQKLLDNVFPGTYKCFVVIADEDSWGHRVAELHVVESTVYDGCMDLRDITYDPEPVNCVIGVDSGQCGIFDADYYEEHQPDNDYDDLNSWYRKVCELTRNAGVIDGLGVACMSGYGDGAYDLWTAKDDDNKVFAMKVAFIINDEDDE